jgi:hypothetical protein
METKVKRKTGPRPKPPTEKLSSVIAIRVNPVTKHVYSSLAEGFGLTDADLFYNLMHVCSFMNYIMPSLEKALDEETTSKTKEQHELFLAKLKVMMRGFSLISDLEQQSKWVRGKNEKTDPQQIEQDVSLLLDYLQKKHLSKEFV